MTGQDVDDVIEAVRDIVMANRITRQIAAAS